VVERYRGTSSKTTESGKGPLRVPIFLPDDLPGLLNFEQESAKNICRQAKL